MPLYLVSNLYDEGIYPYNFRVVEAASLLLIATHMLVAPHQWEFFLNRSVPRNWQDKKFNSGSLSLWDCVQDPNMTSERLLELIEMTSVDGDSDAQLAIHEITIQSLSEINTDPCFRS